MEIDPRSFLAKLGGGGRELQLGELSKAFCNRQMVKKCISLVDFARTVWFHERWRDEHAAALRDLHQRALEAYQRPHAGSACTRAT